jgi:glycosyltransferase involved in cell wall biosynthesis
MQIINASLEFAKHSDEFLLIFPEYSDSGSRRIGPIFENLKRNVRHEILTIQKRKGGEGKRQFVDKAMRKLDRWKPDAVISRNLEFACKAVDAGYVSVFESHNIDKNRRTRRDLFDRWVRVMKDPSPLAATITTTNASKSFLVDRCEFPEARIHVARNTSNLVKCPVDEGQLGILRKELGIAETDTVITYSGHLYKGKGVNHVLSAAERIPQHRFLVIGGEDKDVERYKALAESRNLANVIFTGFVLPEALPLHLHLSSYLVMLTYSSERHSRQYTSPMKLFDYLGVGRPIVAFDLKVLHEVFDNENAVFVKEADVDELVEAIYGLDADAALAKRLGDNARRTALDYTWEERTLGILQWLKSLPAPSGNAD